MKKLYTLTLGVVVAALVGTSSVAHADVDVIIKQFPAENANTANKLFDQLLDEGEDAIVTLYGHLVPAGEGDDNPARYALTGLARYASRPDADDDRALVESALIRGLEAAENPEVAHYLLRQLQQCGTNGSVRAIKAFLLDDATASHAILALDAIDTRKSERALRGALRKTSPDTQLSLLAALADEGRNWRAVNVIEKRLESDPAPNEYVQLLDILVAIRGDRTHKQLIDAMDREEPHIRKAALRHAAEFMDKHAARKWRKKVQDNDTPDEAKREIGQLLAAYEEGM